MVHLSTTREPTTQAQRRRGCGHIGNIENGDGRIATMGVLHSSAPCSRLTRVTIGAASIRGEISTGLHKSRPTDACEDPDATTYGVPLPNATQVDRVSTEPNAAGCHVKLRRPLCECMLFDATVGHNVALRETE